MWVFGYGSLMWDGWEEERGCISKSVATLNGYARRFNKASVVNWGTQTCPGPTLNLVPDTDSVCVGMLFQFSESARDAILGYLVKREGKAFEIEDLKVVLQNAVAQNAYVPIYRGANILHDDQVALLRRVMEAQGKSGLCRDYIFGIDSRLKSLGISDPTVVEMADRLRESLQRD